MSNRLRILRTFGLLILAFSVAGAARSAEMDRSDFRAAMRKLWEDHITWTRLYIVSAIADLPDKDATARRLLQNQTDIGNAIKPFYGDAAGTKLTSSRSRSTSSMPPKKGTTRKRTMRSNGGRPTRTTSPRS